MLFLWVETMEFNIVKEKYNPFLKRKELEIVFIHPGEPTPSKEKINNIIKEKYGVDESQIEINYVISKFGSPESIAKVKIYDEKREVKKVEAQPSENK